MKTTENRDELDNRRPDPPDNSDTTTTANATGVIKKHREFPYEKFCDDTRPHPHHVRRGEFPQEKFGGRRLSHAHPLPLTTTTRVSRGLHEPFPHEKFTRPDAPTWVVHEEAAIPLPEPLLEQTHDEDDMQPRRHSSEGTARPTPQDEVSLIEASLVGEVQLAEVVTQAQQLHTRDEQLEGDLPEVPERPKRFPESACMPTAPGSRWLFFGLAFLLVAGAVTIVAIVVLVGGNSGDGPDNVINNATSVISSTFSPTTLPSIPFTASSNNMSPHTVTSGPTSIPSVSLTSATPSFSTSEESAPTNEPTIVIPPTAAHTASPTGPPTTAQPTALPTVSPATAEPTSVPTTARPTLRPTTSTPTTARPTLRPTTLDSLTAFGEVWDIATTTEIDLAKQLLSGTIPSELSLLTALTQISLYENAFTGPIPSELAVLTEVNRLSLSQNSLTGTIPAELGMMTALTQLTLYDNALTGPIPSELALLTELTRLSLSENDLDGSIPSELGSLTALTTLTLNVNQLTSSIPSELGRLTALIYLSLSNNNLSGPLPSEMGLLTALTSLYLTNNELTGTIPSTLCANDEVSVTVDELDVTCPSTPRPTARPTPVPAPQPTGSAPAMTESCVNVGKEKCCETCWTSSSGTYCESYCE